MRLSLEQWLAERRDNCLRIAENKTRQDRDGWLEDARYFGDCLAVLARFNISAEMIMRGYKGETK